MISSSAAAATHRALLGAAATVAAVLLGATPRLAAAQHAMRASAPPPTASSAAAAAGAGGGGGGFDGSVSLVASTLGLGAEFNKLLLGHLSARVGGYFLNYNLTQTQDGVDYDGKIALRSFSALVDFYPFRRGSFHLSGGVVGGSNDITGVGVPQPGGTFTINGTDYTSAEVSALNAKATFPSTRPYAGLGWGSPAKHGFHLTTDFGAVFGSPEYTLSATGPGSPSLQADLEASQQKTQKDADKYVKVFPVFRMGLTYAF